MSIGPTGDFPRGKFNADDEGGLCFAVGHQDKTVIVNFGKPVKWIGLDANGAMELAELIIAHALECGATRPLTLGRRRG
jgi:hypothetical protein